MRPTVDILPLGCLLRHLAYATSVVSPCRPHLPSSLGFHSICGPFRAPDRIICGSMFETAPIWFGWQKKLRRPPAQSVFAELSESPRTQSIRLSLTGPEEVILRLILWWVSQSMLCADRGCVRIFPHLGIHIHDSKGACVTACV